MDAAIHLPQQDCTWYESDTWNDVRFDGRLASKFLGKAEYIFQTRAANPTHAATFYLWSATGEHMYSAA
jgi:hypothetical protein